MTTLAWVVMGVLVLLVVGVNLSLFMLIKGKQTGSEIDILRKASHSLRSPWRDENERLNELSRKVSDLRRDSDHHS